MSNRPGIAQRAVNATWSLFTGKQASTRTITRRIRPAVHGKRSFAAGDVDTPTQNFLGSNLSVNEELRRSLPRMRARSRQLCMDNDYAKRFLHMVKTNVVGPSGINLQCQFLNDKGEQDIADCQMVEGKFREWGKRKNCSIDGQVSWLSLQALVISTIARDGEVLVEKISNRKNKFGLRLRVMECDHLDINHNEIWRNGNRVVMGVEMDNTDKPVAYHLSDLHPGGSAGNGHQKRRRVLATNMLHIFITERPGQVRGIPWMHTAIKRLNMLGGYEEAELVAARIGASKMGFYTTPEGDGPSASSFAPGSDDDDDGGDYDLVEEVEPGLIQNLPVGAAFTSFDPTHPTTAYADFTREVLRGAASGLNVAYNTWANDLEGVNFSSIRSGVLDERDQWRVVQTWLADELHGEVFDDWFNWQVDFGELTKLPQDKLETKFADITWQARGWDWVDPLKDVRAKAEEYELGVTTLTDIAASKGKTLLDIFKQKRAELDLAEEYGLEVGKLIYHAMALEEKSDEEQTIKPNKPA